MNGLKRSVVFVALLAAALVVSVQTASAQKTAPPVPSVLVTNTAAHPVPVTGTFSVGAITDPVTVTGTVGVSGTVDVAFKSTPTVNVGNTVVVKDRAQTPFSAHFSASLDADQELGQVQLDTDLPEGRTVIEYVGIHCWSPAADADFAAAIMTPKLTDSAIFTKNAPLPAFQRSMATFFGWFPSASVFNARFYADRTPEIYVPITVNLYHKLGAAAQCNGMMSGYTVPLQ